MQKFARSISVIEIQALSAGYGKLVVLHEINLTFATNQFSAILGPNGSGKSTLLKSIFGLTSVFGGKIQFEGKNVVGIPTEAIGQQGIAYVPQRENVFTTMTVRENLLLALRKIDKQQAVHALEEAYELFPILPKRQHQRAGQLSGGERQMVAIALGWLTRPRAILLDEPSAGLSPALSADVFSTLQQLAEQNITLIVVEQNARSVLQWCEHVFVLREGQLAFQGTVEACRTNEELVKQYLGVGGKKNTPADQ
ncbi:MAG: ABC transporter ATP-binding protein [Candidatus Methanoperedens sp.]|nr:ABC transporter ATP-binding protein [Candidatus Methanoperedens sp.]